MDNKNIILIILIVVIVIILIFYIFKNKNNFNEQTNINNYDASQNNVGGYQNSNPRDYFDCLADCMQPPFGPRRTRAQCDIICRGSNVITADN